MSARARNSFEMRFFISLQACPTCNTRIDPAPLQIYGDTSSWAMSGDCRHCGNPLGFTFLTNGDPIHAERRYDELGPGRSELISPAMFIAEIERLLPTIVTEPTTLGIREWRQNRDAVDRLEVCTNELARFLEPGATAISQTLLSPAELEARRDHPEPYTRPWIENMEAFHKRVSAAIIADLPRIDALESAQDAKRPKGVAWLEREHLQAHAKWVERGNKGKGKLVLVGASHEDMKVGRGVELSGATFFDVSMPGAYLDDAKLRGAKLTDASFERGQLYGAELRGAKILRGSFRGANLETAELHDAIIDGTDFTQAELHLTEWAKAQVINAKFERATFGDAKLDGATFKSCNFQNADFSADDPDAAPTTRATFEDCDFTGATWTGRDVSGATFVRCTGVSV